MFHVIFAATLIAIGLRLWRSDARPPAHVVKVALFYFLTIQWGIGGASMAIPHIVVPDLIAGFIGWAPGSPFQVELGFASLGLSLLGILCFWIRGWFWLAPVVGQSVFLLGAAWVHIVDIIGHGNLAPGNAGAILFYDIAVPLIVCSLFFAHVRYGGMEEK